MSEVQQYDVDSVDERVKSLLATPFSVTGKSMEHLREVMAFINDVTAMNKSGAFTLGPDEGRQLVDIYLTAKDEYANRRRVEEATGLTWAKFQLTLDTA